MRKILFGIMIATAAAASGWAQSTNGPIATAQPAIQTTAQGTSRAVPKTLRPNEAVLGKTVASGIAVQVVQTKNPLQLINPFAPSEYGAARDSIAWNPINGNPAGIKIFAIHF